MAQRSWLPTLALTALALAAAACGGSAGSARSTATPSVPAAASTPASAAPSTVGIKAANSPYGSILVTTAGHTLYGLTADTATKSACTSAACVAVWPPLLVTGPPQVGSGVSDSLIGQLARPDGSHQLSYGGHPLYTFASDTAPGQVHGEGITNFGGTWYVVSATTGKLVTAEAPGGATSRTTSTSSGYGYGY